MFETSSILPMLGMAAQMKGAVQGRMGAQGLSPVLPTDAGTEMQPSQALDANASLFHMMLGIAIPQAGAQAMQHTGARTDDAVSTSAALPFTGEENASTDADQQLTATAMMPFYPVLWNATPAMPVDAAAATQGTEAATDAAAASSPGVQAGAGTTALQAALMAAHGNADTPVPAGQNATKAVEISPPIAAALEGMTPVSESAQPLAASQREAIVSAGTAADEKQSAASTGKKSETPAASDVLPKISDAAALAAKNSAAQAGAATIDVNTSRDAAQAASASSDVAASGTANVQAASAQTVHEGDNAADVRTAPQRDTSSVAAPTGNTAPSASPAPAVTGKQTAALAWAAATLRRYSTAQAEVRTTQAQAGTATAAIDALPASTPGSQETTASAASASALPVPEVKIVPDAAPAHVQQKIVTAPETQTKLHETVMAAAAPDLVKPALRTSASALSAGKNKNEGEASVNAAAAEVQLSAQPALRAVDQPAAVQARMREETAPSVKTEAAAEIRPVKTDLLQQPLVNSAELQRQFVPLSETKAAVTPKVREEVFEQVFKGVSTIKHTPSSVDVTLSPESLGTVNVKVGVEEGKMAARIDVQNVEVKHIIEANMPRLHEALSTNGLTLDSVAVFVNNGSSFAERRNDAPRKKSTGGGAKIDDGFEPLSTTGDSKRYGYNTVEYIM